MEYGLYVGCPLFPLILSCLHKRFVFPSSLTILHRFHTFRENESSLSLNLLLNSDYDVGFKSMEMGLR